MLIASTSPTHTTPSISCSWYPSTIHYGLPELFAAVYAWSGAYATINEVSGVDHTLGIGYFSGGSHGSWSASGSSAISAGAGGEDTNAVDAYAWNLVNYRDVVWSCAPGYIDRDPYTTNSILDHYTYAGHQYFSTCASFASGYRWKNAGKNVTYGAGVNIGPITVSAQSGWNTSNEIKWTFTAPTKLCGSTISGWASSPQAEAHSG